MNPPLLQALVGLMRVLLAGDIDGTRDLAAAWISEVPMATVGSGGSSLDTS